MPAPSNGVNLDHILREVFGFSSLRPGQGAVIDDVMAGHSVITVMPTGAGKSLCYQLPAAALGLSGGITLVVSPLIALMKDQVDSLRERGIATCSVTSAASGDEQEQLLAGMVRGDYRIVFVAPERFRSGRFRSALEAVRDKIGLFAVDEAHCISEWGHDFRPDYRRLGAVLRELRADRVIAMTATATPEVRRDIAEQLGLEAPRYHVRGFARPSLEFVTEHSGGQADKCKRLERWVRGRGDGAALVYAATRKNTEAYAAALGEAGFRVRVYHAGLGDDERTRAQDDFMSGTADVVVATNAFGMGIDKADVRVVVHADIPRSAEAYYQEAGRAGRDGIPSKCVLLFNHRDVGLQEFLIDVGSPDAGLLREIWKLLRDEASDGSADAVRKRLGELPAYAAAGMPSIASIENAVRLLVRHGMLAGDGQQMYATRPQPGEFPPLDVDALAMRAAFEHRKLRSMVEYAYSSGCRQRFLLDYFGDEGLVPDWRCETCDNCRGEGATRPLAEDEESSVLVLLGLVAQLPGRFGRTRLANIANGKEEDSRYYELHQYGALRGTSTKQVVDLLRSLEGGGLIKRGRGEYPTLEITSVGEDVLGGRRNLEMVQVDRKARAKKKKSSKAASGAPVSDDATTQKLYELRTELAREREVPAYIIFSNRTLSAIAECRPQTMDELGEVPGIGPKKLADYGELILRAIDG